MKQSPVFWETITKRSQFSPILACSTGHSCVPGIVLLWFDFGFLTTAVRQDSPADGDNPVDETIIANFSSSSESTKCLSFYPFPACFQNKSCSSSRRSCCHGLTDSNIVQSFSSSRLQCKHNFSSWWHVTRIHKF